MTDDWECKEHSFVKMYCGSCVDEALARMVRAISDASDSSRANKGSPQEAKPQEAGQIPPK